jgi:hypothetical protein
MNKEIQEMAINLGASIGFDIINLEGANKRDNKRDNAKNGRKYLIGVSKSRTLSGFLEAIERIQNKYKATVKKDLLIQINEENFRYIKQFVTISALNIINSTLKSFENETK